MYVHTYIHTLVLPQPTGGGKEGVMNYKPICTHTSGLVFDRGRAAGEFSAGVAPVCDTSEYALFLVISTSL